MENKIETIDNAFIGESLIKLTHKSGLTVFFMKKDFTSAYAMLGTRYGSFDNVFELDGETVSVPAGIAHFLEHKMFETEDGQDTFELFSELGADANAYTSTDRTAYLFSCTEDFYDCLEVLVKMVTTPVFTEANVQKEQGIIGQEIKMCEDRPQNILHYNLMRALYKESPVRIPIAGTIQSISEITPSLLYKCYGAFYRMNNMALCICADAEIERITEILDRLLPEKEEDAVVFSAPEGGETVNQPYIEQLAEVARPLFEIGIKLPEACKENAAALDVLCEAVFGLSEDFYSECFESELVSSYQNYFEYSRTASYFEIGGDSAEPMLVLEKLKEYASKLRENGIEKDAFERAKRKAYADVLFKFNSSESIAEELFEAFLADENLLSEAQVYDAVTYEQVQALAKTVFSDERFAISVVMPYEMEGQEN